MIEAIGFMGPYGSGKTESLANVGGALQQDGYVVRAIINDLGNAEADRDRMSAKGIDLLGLNGGCVGCGDTGSFRRELERAVDDNVDRLLFEAPATLHADEVREEVGRFYEDTSVITVWDALGHERNSNFGPAVQPLIVADVVGLTKHENMDPRQVTKIYRDLTRTAMQGVEIVPLPRDQYGARLLESVAASKRMNLSRRVGSVACSEPGHHHDHTHGHGHGHGHDDIHDAASLPELDNDKVISWLDNIDTVYGVSLLAADVASIDELTATLSSANVIRAKGGVSINGRMFVLQHTPEQTEVVPTDSPRQLYAYGQSPADLLRLQSIAERRHQVGSGSASYKSMIALHGQTGPLTDLLHEKLSQYPSGVTDANGDLMTDFGEADIAYQIAKQRPDIDHTTRAAAFESYIDKRLQAVAALNIYAESADLARYKLRLGVVLAFHHKESEAHLITDEQKQAIAATNPWALIMEGLAETEDVSMLNFDEKRRVAEENPELIASLLSDGTDENRIDPSQAVAAFDAFRRKYTDVNSDEVLNDWWMSTELE